MFVEQAKEFFFLPPLTLARSIWLVSTVMVTGVWEASKQTTQALGPAGDWTAELGWIDLVSKTHVSHLSPQAQRLSEVASTV